MTTPLKIAAVAAATLVLANCSGTGNVNSADLPVRDGPQSQAPYTLVAPATVIVTDA